jgi:hypothetical protein
MIIIEDVIKKKLNVFKSHSINKFKNINEN